MEALISGEEALILGEEAQTSSLLEKKKAVGLPQQPQIGVYSNVRRIPTGATRGSTREVSVARRLQPTSRKGGDQDDEEGTPARQ